MKRITHYTLMLLCIGLIFIACEPKDPIVEKGNLESASYDADTQVFTLTYSSGQTEKQAATIDNSTQPPSASAKLSDGTLVVVNDAEKSGKAEIYDNKKAGEFSYVNDWIYDEMSIYYLWNDKIPKRPNFSLKPDLFFESILYRYNARNPDGDRFSWIQDNYLELLQSLSGVSSDEIGFEYAPVWATSERTNYYLLVTYAKKGTDAFAKGIKRGDFVTQINGQNITRQNLSTLVGGTGTKTLSISKWKLNQADNKFYLSSDGDVTVSMHNKFAENPIYLDSVYTFGDQKIGYLSYNFFATDKGDKSYDYDKLLMQRLQAIKDKGAKEMVLDLRYNSGGAVSSAIALSSALVKNRSTNNVLVTSQYNSLVHNALKKENGPDYNKEYFIDQIKVNKNVIAEIPEMNLDKIYILTGYYTASASEFVINGLKPYMDVVLIGETTYGKNVGSISLYEEKDPKNKWAMQPIVVKFANSLGHSDFTAGFTPDYEIEEFEKLFLYQIGDTNDPLLAKAISLITGTTTKSAIAQPNVEMRSLKATDQPIVRKSIRFELHDDKNQDKILNLFKQ